jgi:hypothetical protein
MMKFNLFVLALIFGLFSCSTLNTSRTGSLTSAEAASGIREALEQGVGKGIALLNKENGFFGNQAYKLLLPPDAQKIENTLRQVGMGALVDRAILQVNRAAEDAVGSARPIFTEAITQMTIPDALNIIKGPNDAATQYFREKTTDKLVSAFTPVIKTSLDRFSATKYYSDMINTYNGFPTTLNKLNPDLTSYVVNKTVNALFDQIAKEEANIRANPRARTTELLKKVFGRS